MGNGIEDAAEYKRCQEFMKSGEFKRLTSGDSHVFKNFDKTSADDWNQMCNYLNDRYDAIGYKIEVKEVKSCRLAQLQLGKLLLKRDEYEAKMPKEQIESYGQCVTVHRQRRLGRLPLNLYRGLGRK